MKIAVCDDEKRDRENIINLIQKHNTQHKVYEFNSAIPFMESIDNGEAFDVLFLDIDMPDSDGWIVAEQLKADKPNIYIVMVTVKSGYIYDCFDRVDWFFPKPIQEFQVNKVLNNAYDRLSPALIEFECNKIPVVLTVAEIMYIEVKRNDVFIHATEKSYKIRDSLVNINKKFSFPCFASPYQSYTINLDHYDTIDDGCIILKNKEKIPLSRHKSKDFYDSLREYVRRKKSHVF